jgi:hypothetical protein
VIGGRLASREGGDSRHARTGERLNYRNGCRKRSLDTRLGSLQQARDFGFEEPCEIALQLVPMSFRPRAGPAFLDDRCISADHPIPIAIMLLAIGATNLTRYYVSAASRFDFYRRVDVLARIANGGENRGHRSRR